MNKCKKRLGVGSVLLRPLNIHNLMIVFSIKNQTLVYN